MAYVQRDALSGDPQLVGQLVVDKATALTAAQSISAALFAQSKTGEGQHLEISMVDAAVQFIYPDSYANDVWKVRDARDASALSPPMPPFSKICKLYKVKDGHISMICVSDQEFLAL